MIILSSENYEDLKNSLENGWKIKEIKISINGIKKEESIKVILERGRDQKTITAINDQEFSEYILHFKAFPDQYGNSEFVYVEDMESYNKELEGLRHRGKVPKRPYKILIGGREIKKPHLYHLVLPGPKTHVGAANFFVNLKENPKFCDIDLRDEIEVFFTDNNQKVFGGFPHSVSYSPFSAVFLCLGGDRRLHEGRITTEFLIDFKTEGADALYFLAESAGFKSKFHGESGPNLSSRQFKVIFPVHGLKIPCDFRVENVLFTSKLQNELADKAKKGKTLLHPLWSGASVFVVVVIEGKHFFEALVQAEIVAQRAVDWIQLRTDLTIPCISIAGKKRLIYYNLRKNFSRCQLSRYGLVIDLKTGSAIFHRLDVRAGHPLVIKYNPDEFIQPIVPICRKITSVSNKNEKEIQRLHQALNWMMFSFEKELPINNLLQLWISCEFICSNEKVPGIVERQSIKKAIASIKKLDIPENEKDELVKSICEVNDPPLIVKWNHLLDRLKVQLTAQELYLISRLRSARNKIMHGDKEIKVSIGEIEKLRSILERVFLSKIESL